MMRRVGSRPSTQAVKPTETVIDFMERGGTLMIRRRISPRATRRAAAQVIDMPIVLVGCAGLEGGEDLLG